MSRNGGAEWQLTKEERRICWYHDILQQNTSIVSGRTMEQIAAQRDTLWTREQGSGGEAVAGRLCREPVPAELPAFIAPQLASPADAPVPGDQWLHEIKYDGYRVLCRMDAGTIDFFSRRGSSITGSLPRIMATMRKFPVTRAWFDGEIVVLGPDGTASFSDLQSARRSGNG